jgi:DNA-binding beta-propeller fold protein YncE
MIRLAGVINLFEQSKTSSMWRLLGGRAFSVFATLVFFASSALVGANEQTRPGRPSSKPVSNPEGDDRDRLKDQRVMSGWLYVLDNNNMKNESQVLLVDPEQERVVRTFKAGQGPDMILSPDGTRLYLASALRKEGRLIQNVLQVIDTTSGKVLQTVDNPDHSISTLRESVSRMAISRDGRYVYASKNRVTWEGVFNYLATFDTAQGQFLPETAPLPRCGVGRILVSPDDSRLNVLCHNTNDIRFLDLAENGAQRPLNKAAGSRTATPPKLSLALGLSGTTMHSRGLVVGFLSQDGLASTVIMGDGRFFNIDNQSRTIMQANEIDSETRKIISTSSKTSSADDWLSDSWIRFQDLAISADGTKLYIGISRLVHLRQGVRYFDRVVVLDSQTLKRIETINLPRLANSVAISRDGRRLYAISPDQACITIIDTASRESRTIYSIGTSPIRAIVAP